MNLSRIAKAFPNYSFCTCALSESTGRTYLYWPEYNGCEFTSLASLNEQAARDWLSSETLYGFDPSKLMIRSLEIETRTLDSFDLEPYFIKIDVEGMAHGVLLGGLQTIKKTRPILLIEDVKRGDNVDRLLAELNYAVFSYRPRERVFMREEYGSLNSFFFPKESPIPCTSRDGKSQVRVNTGAQ
jgi:FkbM family methyltransferase